jgi:outer membrane immunogenic protein
MTRRQSLVAATASFALLCAAPAMAQNATPWTGWYIGGNAGGVWGDASAQIGAAVGPGGGNNVVINPLDVTAINGATTSGSGNTSGFTGGIEGGYNWVSGGFLFGIESDWDFMDISQRATRTATSPLLISPPITYTLSQEVKSDWLWTLRPRFGFVTDQWLFYGTVGLAVTDVKNTVHFTDSLATPHVVSQDTSDTKTGWIGGLGAAYAWSPEWSIKGEWLYLDVGTVDNTIVGSNGFVVLNSHASVRGNIFRLGVDYRF